MKSQALGALPWQASLQARKVRTKVMVSRLYPPNEGS